MAWMFNQWYTLTFPTYGDYKLLVMCEELDEIPAGVWWFEMENIKDGRYFQTRVVDTDTPCSYALTNQGKFCETGPNPGEGMANLLQDPFSTYAFSADIQIVSSDQWLNIVKGKYFLDLFFRMGDTPLAPCENGGEEPSNLNGGPASFYFPVPPGTPPEKKKMEKKKVKIIWTVPH